jgi:ATP-dependent DNA helicase RecG
MRRDHRHQRQDHDYLAHRARHVGGRTANALEKAFGLRTTGDLLRHYPRRYVRRGDLTDLASLQDGEQVTVFAQVAKVTSRRMQSRRGRLLEVTVTDGSARLALTFFNKVEFWERQLSPGRHGMFAGKVSTFAGKRQLAHPEFKLLGADDVGKAAEYAAELIPVYPATREFSSWDIEKCVRVVLDTLGEVDDPLPEALRQRHRLDGLATALRSQGK